MTLEELIDICQGEVSLTVNEHRTYYQSPQDWFVDCMRSQWSECPPMMADPLPWPADAETYNLQFYPETPIGSHHIVGTTFASVLQLAALCFDEA